MKAIEPRVEALVKQRPDLGTNDTKLWIAYISVYDGVRVIDGRVKIDDLINSTPFESVSRARRSVRTKDPTIFDAKVEEKRFEKYQQTTDEYGSPVMIYRGD